MHVVWLSTKNEINQESIIENTPTWIQPSVVTTEPYFDGLKQAYDFLLHIETNFGSSCDTVLRELEALECEKIKRKSIVAKLFEDMDNLPPLSIRLLTPLATSKTLIPGACTIGQKGLDHIPDGDSLHATWSDSDQTSDISQSAAKFERDYSKKGYPSVKVTLTHALERPIVTPMFHVWDPTQMTTTKSETEHSNGMIPNEMAKGMTILNEKLKSKIDKYTPSPIITCDDPASICHQQWLPLEWLL